MLNSHSCKTDFCKRKKNMYSVSIKLVRKKAIFYTILYLTVREVPKHTDPRIVILTNPLPRTWIKISLRCFLKFVTCIKIKYNCGTVQCGVFGPGGEMPKLYRKKSAWGPSLLLKYLVFLAHGYHSYRGHTERQRHQCHEGDYRHQWRLRNLGHHGHHRSQRSFLDSPYTWKGRIQIWSLRLHNSCLLVFRMLEHLLQYTSLNVRYRAYLQVPHIKTPNPPFCVHVRLRMHLLVRQECRTGWATNGLVR